MATQRIKNTGNKQGDKGSYLTKDNWEVMKPFAHFAFKAITVIGATLLAIVKLMPKALEHKSDDDKKDKIIKI